MLKPVVALAGLLLEGGTKITLGCKLPVCQMFIILRGEMK
jgi:hypothetical protein